MNERFERIFELAKQADLIQWDSLPSGARTPDHESVFKARKFAELLIRECVGVVNANMDDILDQPVFNPTDEIWNRARVEELVRVALHIKKHFGVEE